MSNNFSVAQLLSKSAYVEIWIYHKIVSRNWIRFKWVGDCLLIGHTKYLRPHSCMCAISSGHRTSADVVAAMWQQKKRNICWNSIIPITLHELWVCSCAECFCLFSNSCTLFRSVIYYYNIFYGRPLPSDGYMQIPLNHTYSYLKLIWYIKHEVPTIDANAIIKYIVSTVSASVHWFCCVVGHPAGVAIENAANIGTVTYLPNAMHTHYKSVYTLFCVSAFATLFSVHSGVQIRAHGPTPDRHTLFLVPLFTSASVEFLHNKNCI